jgi:hypothetical protein
MSARVELVRGILAAFDRSNPDDVLEDELIARVEFFFDPERARAALEAE